MYAGRIVEEGPVEQIFDSPQHPYTWSLLRSVPRVDVARVERLVSIKGLPPDLIRLPPGCKFHPRCRFKVEKCEREEPPLEQVAPDQEARCWVLMRNVPTEQREETKAGEVSHQAATELKEAGSG
jgi:oligopeptide/dipeptide ABC transporter ATP-binding protein